MEQDYEGSLEKYLVQIILGKSGDFVEKRCKREKPFIQIVSDVF